MTIYSNEFYETNKAGSSRSAGVVVPLVMDLINPNSVIDVGSGVGTWLSKFEDHGVKDITGVDGDYVDRSRLEIPENRFMAADLREPLHLARTFDLVVSLEVAEHLPSECAAEFIASLARLGNVVLFSAAIPYQGGTNHVNEQWPDYWARHFEANGFVPVDCIRRKIWRNTEVEWWYAQNLLVFVAEKMLSSYPRLQREFELMGADQLSVVHPQKYLYCIQWGEGLQQSLVEAQAESQEGEG